MNLRKKPSVPYSYDNLGDDINNNNNCWENLSYTHMILVELFLSVPELLPNYFMKGTTFMTPK